MGSSASAHLRDLSGTALASVIATAVDGALFSMLCVASDASTELTIAGCAAAGSAAGGVVHFALLRRWVFQRFHAPIARAAPRYAMMSLAAAAGHVALTTLLTGLIAAPLAWGLSKLLVYLGWTYPVSRYHVFSNR